MVLQIAADPNLQIFILSPHIAADKRDSTNVERHVGLCTGVAKWGTAGARCPQ